MRDIYRFRDSLMTTVNFSVGICGKPLAWYFRLVFLCLLCPIDASRRFCSSDFKDDPTYPYRFYQGSTRYETVRGEVTSSDRPLKCVPKSIVFIARHGSRHPGIHTNSSYRALDKLQSMINSTGSATLCRQDLTKILRWRNWYRASLDKNLAATGVEEMRGLGKRFASVFPELFSHESTQGQRFISTDYQRTVESARVFMNASLDRKSAISIELNNLLLESWIYCKYYGKMAVTFNEGGGNAERRFREVKVRRLAKKLAQRLGVPRNVMTRRDMPQTIYTEGCAREAWATGKDSPWCLALSKRDKQILEFGLDMHDYFKHMSSSKYRQSCQLKRFMLSALRNASTQVSRNESATNFFFFTHKPTVLQILREMKFIEDEGPFRGRDFKSRMNRTFRISKLVPGSGNVAFILHQCADDRMKLQVFHNERLLKLPLHQPNRNGLWDLEEALEYLGLNDPNDCNFEEICPYGN